jgi:hypothetical protein
MAVTKPISFLKHLKEPSIRSLCTIQPTALQCRHGSYGYTRPDIHEYSQKQDVHSVCISEDFIASKTGYSRTIVGEGWGADFVLGSTDVETESRHAKRDGVLLAH